MNKEEFIGKLQMVYVGDKRAVNEIISEYDRLKENINTAIEDIFTLRRVLNANVKELKCTDEELKVINKYSYNPKENK